MEDGQIVQLYWQRSEDAIAETAEKYGTFCHSISYGILRDRQDAEECVIDTWLRAWDAMPPQRPQRLAAFLAKITRNLSLDRYRKRTAQFRGFGQVPLALEELQWSVPSPDNVETMAEAAELTASLERFLYRLPREKRQVFLLRYWYFRTIGEIADQMRMSEQKVTSMLFRVRKELKKHLEEEGIGL